MFKKVLALHLLPYKKIPNTFKALEKEQINIGKHLRSDERRLLKRFFSYVTRQWIKSKCWGPKKWSVFNQAIRTNNDAEGWHNRIYSKAKKELNFYELVELLFKEADLINLQAKLLCQQKMMRQQIMLSFGG